MVDLRVTRARRIYSDGQHNAFTSIARLGDTATVAFRSATTHISFDGTIKLIQSPDMETWAVTAELALPSVDLRDPKVVAFQGQLLVFCGGREPSRLGSFVSLSADGQRFGAVTPLQGIPAGYWLWSIVSFEGALYGSAYTSRADEHEVSLYHSNDGVGWEKLADFPVPGNETSIDFDAEGRLWALVRDDGHGSVPTLCAAEPPYRSFASYLRLPIRLQGPMLKRLPGVCVIAGRRWDQPGRTNLRTDLFVLEDGQDIRFVRSLPSGGDTSYAGWLDTAPGRAVISYYSAHEHKMDAPAVEDQQARRSVAHAEHTTPADIYLADVSYALR